MKKLTMPKAACCRLLPEVTMKRIMIGILLMCLLMGCQTVPTSVNTCGTNTAYKIDGNTINFTKANPDSDAVLGKDCGAVFKKNAKVTAVNLTGPIRVTDASGLFAGSAYVTEMNLAEMDISGAADMSGMFEGCSSLTSLDMSGWDTSLVSDADNMFSGCNSLRTLTFGQKTLSRDIFESLPAYYDTWAYEVQGPAAAEPLPLMTEKTDASLFTEYDFNTMAGTWDARPSAASLTITDSAGNDITGERIRSDTLSCQLSVSVESAGGIENVSWVSSDPDTASVDETGRVLFKNAGTVRITVSSADNPQSSAYVDLEFPEPETEYTIINPIVEPTDEIAEEDLPSADITLENLRATEPADEIIEEDLPDADVTEEDLLVDEPADEIIEEELPDADVTEEDTEEDLQITKPADDNTEEELPDAEVTDEDSDSGYSVPVFNYIPTPTPSTVPIQPIYVVPTQQPQVKTLTIITSDGRAINGNVLTGYVGISYNFGVSAQPADTSISVTWMSSNSWAVTVTPWGEAGCRSAGSAVLTAAATDGSGLTASFTLQCINPRMTGMSILNSGGHIVNGETRTGTVGQSYTYSIRAIPANASNAVNWMSSDTSVVTVTPWGEAACRAAGSAWITAAARDGSGVTAGFTLKCVSQVPKMTSMSIVNSSGESISGKTLTGYVERSYSYSVKVKPAEASDAVNWVSSNTSVATVSSDGTVTCKKAGTAGITAAAKDGSGVTSGFILECAVPKMTSMSIITPSGKIANDNTLTGNVGKSYTYSVKQEPTNASGAVTWSSSDSAVAAVTSAGTVTCITVGRMQITATAKDGSGVTAGFTLRCVAPKMTGMSILTSGGKTVNGQTRKGTVGKSYTYSIKPTPAEASKAVTWKSSKPSVVSVTSSGTATCKAAGSAKITATAKDGSGVTASFTLQCVAPTPKMTDMSIITPSGKIANDKTAIGNVSKSYTYTIKPTPANASNAVTWKSSKPSVVSVNSSGTATCKAAGSAKITATAKDGSGVTASFTLQCVIPTPKMTDMSIITPSGNIANGRTLTGNVGKSYTYSIKPTPAEASNAVTWKSSKPSVVSVNSSGTATCKAAGSAKITAAAKDGSGVTASFTLQCVAPTPKMTDMSIITPSGKIANDKTAIGNVGKSYTYTIKPTPANASNAVIWKSSKPSVVSVNSSGTATCKAAGSAKITAAAKDGSGVTASFTLQCVTPTPKMTGMSIITPNGNIANGRTLSGNVGKSYTYSIKAKPANASNAVTWKSANPSAASVNSSGTVTCKAAGSAKITAAAKDGSGVTESFTLQCVNPKMTGMSIITPSGKIANGKTLSGNVGKSYTYSIKAKPANASNAVTWKSANPSAVSVNSSGTVTCKAAGSAKITAAAKDGSGVTESFTLQCDNPKMTSMSIITPSGKTANGKTLSGNVGKSYTYSIKAKPANASNAVTWKSANPSVASVNSSGTVTCKAAGSANITAAAKDGSSVTAGFTLQCAAKVTKMTGMSIITPSGNIANGKTLTGRVGKSYTYSIKAKPANASNAVTWKSSNSSVVSVNSSGTVTCQAAGSAKIAATAKDGSGVKAAFTLKCVKK